MVSSYASRKDGATGKIVDDSRDVKYVYSFQPVSTSSNLIIERPTTGSILPLLSRHSRSVPWYNLKDKYPDCTLAVLLRDHC